MQTKDEVSTEIAEYSPLVAALATLRQKYRGLAFDCSTTKGDHAARAARLDLVRLRGRLEDQRKLIKAPALARSRAIDGDAAMIREAIEELEHPIDEQIRSADAIREQARQERLAAEAARIHAIRERILAAFVSPAADANGRTSAVVLAVIGAIETTPIDDAFADLKMEAQQAKVVSLARLAEHLKRALAVEAQLAELERQRVDFAEQQARAEAEHAAQKRKDDEARAEQKKLDNAAAAERKRIADAAQAAADAAEQKLKADREAFEREQAAAREEAAARQRVIDAALEAERQARAAEETRQREEREAVEAEARRAEYAAAARRLAEHEAVIAAEAQRRAAVIEVQARVERAAPTMLGTLQAVQAWLASDGRFMPRQTLVELVDEAIAEATLDEVRA